MSKKTGIIGAVTAVTGRIADLLFSKGTTPYGGGSYGADLEVVDPIGETGRQLPLDYFKSLKDNDMVAKTGMTKGKFIKTLPKWARPAFENTAYVGFVGPLHQDQIIRLQSEKLHRSTPKVPDYSLKEIDAIMYGMADEAPDAPEELGPNFGKWVELNKKRLSGRKDWKGILEMYTIRNGDGSSYEQGEHVMEIEIAPAPDEPGGGYQKIVFLE